MRPWRSCEPFGRLPGFPLVRFEHETRASPFSYTVGVNWADAAALIGGTAVASRCLATPLFTGLIALARSGTYLSLPACLLISASV